MKIFWKSWSRFEAEFELNRLKEDKVPLENTWVNGHEVFNPSSDDVLFTTNGMNYQLCPCKRVTWYAESINYLNGEYKNYSANRWSHRFHFVPQFATQANSSLLNIMCWWKREKKDFKKQPKFTFGMVLGRKPENPTSPTDFGYFRSKVVQACRNRSFYYYGTAWPAGDPHYKGEKYINGQRHSPQKFNDARLLLKDAKFAWCLENCHDKVYSVNYLTEKIFHGFLSGCVPVYCGCWNVQDLIGPDLFIDVRKFNYDASAVADFCEKMSDSDYKGYQERIAKFLNEEADKFSCDYRFMELDKWFSENYA